MAPAKVNSTNENEILNKVFRINNNKVKFKFKVGDRVRINKVKRTFEKGYITKLDRGNISHITTISAKPTCLHIEGSNG